MNKNQHNKNAKSGCEELTNKQVAASKSLIQNLENKLNPEKSTQISNGEKIAQKGNNYVLSSNESSFGSSDKRNSSKNGVKGEKKDSKSGKERMKRKKCKRKKKGKKVKRKVQIGLENPSRKSKYKKNAEFEFFPRNDDYLKRSGVLEKKRRDNNFCAKKEQQTFKNEATENLLSAKAYQKLAEVYLLNPKKFYNLKVHKKIELMKNSPRTIAKEFYKLDFQIKFFKIINKKFKGKFKELKKYRMPFQFQKGGEIKLDGSYYKLLNSINFFKLCRDCEIHSFDAKSDWKKAAQQKISKTIKILIVKEKDEKEKYEKNLRYNIGRIHYRF